MIDLHCHTTASDGLVPPAAVVRIAAAAGVKTLAISDHDTVEAVDEARREGLALGVRIVPSVEVSARIGEREIHVLGHFVDPSEPKLLARLAFYREGRSRRAREMVEALRGQGIDLHFDELLAIAGPEEGSIGRPHFARLLVTKGAARDFQDAFDRWLGKGKPGWVERPFPTAAEAIELIRGAGGATSLAHPALSGVTGSEIEELASLGLAAIEVGHPGQGEQTRRRLRMIADSLGLLRTAGSDFHGEGSALGSETMDGATFLAYEAAAASTPPDAPNP